MYVIVPIYSLKYSNGKRSSWLDSSNQLVCLAGEVQRTQSLTPSLGPGFLVQAKFKKKKPTMGFDQ